MLRPGAGRHRNRTATNYEKELSGRSARRPGGEEDVVGGLESGRQNHPGYRQNRNGRCRDGGLQERQGTYVAEEATMLGRTMGLMLQGYRRGLCPESQAQHQANEQSPRSRVPPKRHLKISIAKPKGLLGRRQRGLAAGFSKILRRSGGSDNLGAQEQTS